MADIQVPFSEKIKGFAGLFGFHLNETSKYTVVETKGDVEIRDYPSFVTADIEIHGDYETASKTAFAALAEYIFGGNMSHAEMHMTSPVLQIGVNDNVSWKLSFVMPTGYNINNLPKPLDKNIKFVEHPQQIMAALVYSGTNSEEKIEEKSREIYRELALTAYRPMSQAMSAQYDSPATIPFLKHNEILVPVSTKEWTS